MNVKAPEWRLYTVKENIARDRPRRREPKVASRVPLLLSKVLPGPATGSRIVNRATPVAPRSLGNLGGSKGGEGKALGGHPISSVGFHLFLILAHPLILQGMQECGYSKL